MLNNYLEKRAAGSVKKIFNGLWEGFGKARKASPADAYTIGVGVPLVTAGGLVTVGNLTAGDSEETLAALDKAKKDLANERAKGIADHAGDNIGIYALAGTGLLGLGALGAYLASKKDD